MKKLAILFLILFLFPQTLLSGEEKTGSADTFLADNVVMQRLKNGITVILLDRGYAPTLAFEIAFRVGSSDESYHTIGAAHMLEHMLFKGTDRVGTRDYEKEKVILKKIEALGETLDRVRLENPENVLIPDLEARLKALQKEHQQYVVSSPYDRIYTMNGAVGFNASTSRDKTGYYVELPASRLELWADMESERLRNPVLREYYLERNNVMQERLMRYDASGTGRLSEKFIATAFEAHPYRHPIIGWKSSIENLSIKDIRKFYYSHYVPSRMVITIVGKQDVNKTFEVVKKYFENIPARPEPRPPVITEPSQQGEKRFSILFESNDYLMIGWHKPTFPSHDDYVCDVASEILGGGKSSPLYRSLVLEKKLATSVDVWNGYPGARYSNLFVVMAAPAAGHTSEEVEKEVYDVIEKTLLSVSSTDLEKVINRMESDMVFSLSSNKGLAHLLSYYQTIMGRWQYVTGYLDAIKSVTPEQVRDVMKKYLASRNRVVGILRDSRKDGARNEE